VVSFLLAFQPISYMRSSSHLCYMPCPSYPLWIYHSTILANSTKYKLFILQFLMECYNLKVILSLFRFHLQPKRSLYIKGSSWSGPLPERHRPEGL
jgi:hypothetical protein